MRISAFYENIAQGAKDAGAPVEELLIRLRDEGLQTVYAGYSWSVEPREREFFALLDRLGLALEGLWDNIPFNLLTEEESRRRYTALVDCAARNGAKHVLIVPGVFREHGEGRVTREETAEREPEIRLMVERLREAVEYGREQGVAVTMEDYDVFQSPIVFPEVLRRFFEEIPGLKCSFDTGNFIPCGADVMEEFAYYKDKIVALHLKDRVENDDQNGIEREPYVTLSGRRYYPAVVGSGDMHIPEIISEMERTGCDGAGIIEIFSSTDTAAKLLASVRWMRENTRA